MVHYDDNLNTFELKEESKAISNNYKRDQDLETFKAAAKDVINPNHYKAHPSGVECIQITEHMNFNLGNAVKYIWRSGMKDATIQELEKAKWYIDREIQRIKRK